MRLNPNLRLPVRDLPAAALFGAALLGCTVEKDLASAGESASDSADTGGDTAASDPTDTGGDTAASDPTETTGEPATPCPDHPATDDCCCFVLDEGLQTITNVCPAEELCPTAVLSCTGGTPEDCTTEDAAALDCVLQALAGNEPGRVLVRYEDANFPGQIGANYQYFVRSDRTAFEESNSYADLGGEQSATGRRALKPAAFFSECLASDTIEAKFECVRDALEDEALEICVEGFEVNNPY